MAIAMAKAAKEEQSEKEKNESRENNLVSPHLELSQYRSGRSPTDPPPGQVGGASRWDFEVTAGVPFVRRQYTRTQGRRGEGKASTICSFKFGEEGPSTTV